MKNFHFIIIVGFLLISLSNCNKNNNDDPPLVECINSSFADTLAIKLKPAYIEEDNKGNIIILGNNDGVIKVVRLNSDGELQWTKEYPQLQGKEQGLVFIDENSFFVKTSTNHYEYELSDHFYNNMWIRNSNMLDSNNNYIPTYELSGLIQPKLQLENTNTTYLTKVGSEGEILWSKEFSGDACNGDSFYKIDQNNYLMLTSEFYGPYYELITYNGHTDTCDHPYDRNKRTVYKIDSDGEIIWSTVIDNVFDFSYYTPDIPEYQQSITQNNDRIYVNTINNTYELSSSGNLLQNFQPHYNYQGNSTYHMVKASKEENFFYGELPKEYNYVNTKYLMKYNVNLNQIQWEKTAFTDILQISSYPDESIFILGYDNTDIFIEKYNIQGDLLWHKSHYGRKIKAACNGGVIIASRSYPEGMLVLIKTNENGDY